MNPYKKSRKPRKPQSLPRKKLIKILNSIKLQTSCIICEQISRKKSSSIFILVPTKALNCFKYKIKFRIIFLFFVINFPFTFHWLYTMATELRRRVDWLERRNKRCQKKFIIFISPRLHKAIRKEKVLITFENKMKLWDEGIQNLLLFSSIISLPRHHHFFSIIYNLLFFFSFNIHDICLCFEEEINNLKMFLIHKHSWC